MYNKLSLLIYTFLLLQKHITLVCETLIKLFFSFLLFLSESIVHRKRFSFKRCETNLIKTFPMFKIEFNYMYKDMLDYDVYAIVYALNIYFVRK